MYRWLVTRFACALLLKRASLAFRQDPAAPLPPRQNPSALLRPPTRNTIIGTLDANDWYTLFPVAQGRAKRTQSSRDEQIRLDFVSEAEEVWTEFKVRDFILILFVVLTTRIRHRGMSTTTYSHLLDIGVC